MRHAAEQQSGNGWRSGLPASGMAVLLFLCACGDDSSTPAPTVSLQIAPTSVVAGQNATVTWTSKNASGCSATGDEWAGAEPTSGSLTQSLSTPGTYLYTLTCTSSSGGSASSSASLTVTPMPPAITGALSNGVAGLPYNETIQVTGGVAPFAWTVSSGALPHNLALCPGTNAVTVCGTPDTVAQGVTFTIQVTDSAHNTASQAFTISILLQADSLVLSPASLDFGNEIVGRASAALTETLTNTATSAMVISGITIGGSNAAEFSQTNSTCGASLAAGASCVVSLTFTPGQPGLRAAALTITDDTAGSPQSVPLSGVGMTAGPNVTLSVAGLTFRTQLVGTTSPAMSVALTNYGNAALDITSIAASGGFAASNNCVTSVASQVTCVISVTFTPGGSGNLTGTLSITDDAPGSPQEVSLSGTGATTTPLLTGTCYARCQPITKVAACPAGQMAETPAVLFGCPGPPFPGSTPVDLDRPCVVPPGGFHDRGYCVTQ